MERLTAHFTKSVDARPVAQSDSAGWQQVYGTALNATSRSRQEHMTLKLKGYKARIKVSAKSKRIAVAVCDALAPDLQLTPKAYSRAEISIRNSDVIFKIETSDIASFRASINSYLRLADASYKCLTL
jgi:tRNA threonylcarbamoyladenosine modification (KEOPS) complex  Pcc1 subunit